jgi:hypothetical protein
LILNLILLAGPVLTEAGPVLLCTNITYNEFEFDPVASQGILYQASQLMHHPRNQNPSSNSPVVKAHFFNKNNNTRQWQWSTIHCCCCDCWNCWNW